MKIRYVMLAAILALALVPVLAHANARLTNVTPVDGGCVSGPTGSSVQAWDIENGKTYTVRIEGVTECADGGTAATLGVRVNSFPNGNTDLVADFVEAGVYEFNFTMDEEGVCTFPINYCTTPGESNTGIVVTRDDGGTFQAHLRSATFEEGCINPVTNIGEGCDVVGVEESSWGALKAIFN